MLSLLSNFTLIEEEETRLTFDSVNIAVDMGDTEYGEHSQLEAFKKLSTGRLVVTNSYLHLLYRLANFFTVRGLSLWNAEEKIGLSVDFSSMVLHALLAGEGSKVMVQVEAGTLQVGDGSEVLEEEDFDAEDDEFIASWDIVFDLPDKDRAEKLMACISECWSSNLGSDDDEEQHFAVDESDE